MFGKNGKRTASTPRRKGTPPLEITCPFGACHVVPKNIIRHVRATARCARKPPKLILSQKRILLCGDAWVLQLWKEAAASTPLPLLSAIAVVVVG